MFGAGDASRMTQYRFNGYALSILCSTILPYSAIDQ